jgi:hypothetical protein
LSALVELCCWLSRVRSSIAMAVCAGGNADVCCVCDGVMKPTVVRVFEDV